MLEDIKSEEFTVLKGTSLEIEANGQRHTLQVIEVRPYEPHSERPQSPFSVVLLAQRALLLPQGYLSAASSCPRRARSVHGAIGAGRLRHALRDRVQLIRSPFEKMIDAAVFQQPETEAAMMSMIRISSCAPGCRYSRPIGWPARSMTRNSAWR
jgi:hypothetical protein